MDKAIDLMNKSGGSMRNMSKGLKNEMSARVSAAGVDISVASIGLDCQLKFITYLVTCNPRAQPVQFYLGQSNLD